MEEAVESIDIGGPAMVRAASKNFANVAVVVDPADYDRVLAAVKDGSIGGLRQELAAKAFRHTAFYDSMVSRYLTEASGTDPLTETLTIGWRRRLSLRYGENSHQTAALYIDPLGSAGIAHAKQLYGKELSYNNILDAEAAWELVADLAKGFVRGHQAWQPLRRGVGLHPGCQLPGRQSQRPDQRVRRHRRLPRCRRP